MCIIVTVFFLIILPYYTQLYARVIHVRHKKQNLQKPHSILSVLCSMKMNGQAYFVKYMHVCTVGLVKYLKIESLGSFLDIAYSKCSAANTIR